MILYKLTSRSRPANMYRAYRSVIDNTTTNNWVLVLSIDEDDLVTLQSSELALIERDKNVIVCKGYSKNKIHAINRDVFAIGWDILVNLSDDQVFTKKGFNEVITDNCTRDTLLHLPDGYVNERLITMAIMGQDYYKRFGYIYHPDYVSLFCDNEQQDVAQALGCYKYVDEHVFKHLHPAWTGETPDAQLLHTQSFYRRDERVYKKRKSLNFPIESVY